MLPGDDPLTIYLNDHLGGSVAGAELARRLAARSRDTPYGAGLAALAEDVERDREALEDVMQRLGARRDRLKTFAGWGAEKAGRLKFSGHPLRYTPLNRLEDLELLLLGVEGKLALWRALRRTRGSDERLAGVDLDALIERAVAQRRRLERWRRDAADEAFSPSG